MNAALHAATDYPLLNLFWTMLWFFLFIAWIWLLIVVLADVFRSDDMGGWGKALWCIFIIVVPWLGVLIYLIARGGSMQNRAAAEAARRDQAMRAYIQEAAASAPAPAPAAAAAAPAATAASSTADELAKLAQLRDSGALSPEEFAAMKAKVLAG